MNFHYGNIGDLQKGKCIMNKKSIIVLSIILGIFTIGYFTSAIIVSKNFKGNYEEELFEQKIAAIETQAAIYAENTEDLFKDEKSIYYTIEELALANVIVSNKDGVVLDPRDNNNELNNLKVKITNEDGKVTAKVLV